MKDVGDQDRSGRRREGEVDAKCCKCSWQLSIRFWQEKGGITAIHEGIQELKSRIRDFSLLKRWDGALFGRLQFYRPKSEETFPKGILQLKREVCGSLTFKAILRYSETWKSTQSIPGQLEEMQVYKFTNSRLCELLGSELGSNLGPQQYIGYVIMQILYLRCFKALDVLYVFLFL